MQRLSDAVGHKVTAQAISKYENGQMMPSSSVLVALGDALDVSLDFLMSSQVVELAGLKFRQNSRVAASERSRAEAAIIDRLERYLTIEQILDIPHSVEWTEELSCNSVESLEELEGKADELRAAWCLGTGPISSMSDLLEEKGIKVVEESLPEGISGLACDAQISHNQDRVVKAVLVSHRCSVERKRFTLAHELAHQIIQSIDNSEISTEKAMDRFAGAFLVPKQGIHDLVGLVRSRVSQYEIMCIKRKFGVSAACVLTRLGQVGVLPEPTVKRAFQTFARSWTAIEPEPIEHGHGFAAHDEHSRFERLVSQALGEELISPVRAASLLSKPLSYVEQRLIGPLINLG